MLFPLFILLSHYYPFLFSLRLFVTLFIPLDLKQKALLSLLHRYLFLSVWFILSYLYVALMFSFYSVFA